VNATEAIEQVKSRLPGLRRGTRVAATFLLLFAVAAGGCGGIETEGTRAAEEFLRGGPYGPDGARVTHVECEERGDGDVVCEVTAETGTTTCRTNARSGRVTEVDCDRGRRR